MQAPHSPGFPPVPPAPVGPNARFTPGQPLYQGNPSGNLAPPPPSGAHVAGAPGYAHPGNALSPYRPSSGATGPIPTGSAGPRPYSTGPPPFAGTPNPLNQQAPPPSSVYPQTPFQPGPPRVSGRPKKRLVICCDGTWLDSDNGLMRNKNQLPSNVTRISRAIKSETTDNVSQVVYYQGGVGTEGSPASRLIGGATAEGLSSNIREAYAFIAHNHAPGDEIILLGFSRGAFTVRSISGLISAVGLLTKAGIPHLGVIFQDVEHQRDEHYTSAFPDAPFPDKPPASDPAYTRELVRRGLTRPDIPIKAIGVWDTVGSLGIPRVGFLEKLGLQSSSVREYTFYDTALSANVENAFQALALDEQRAPFVPTIWEKPRGTPNRTNLRQVWFPGVHSNVGGGYPDANLADVSLAWMIAQLEPYVEFAPGYLKEQFEANQRYYAEQFSSDDDDDDGEEVDADYSNPANQRRRRPWAFGTIYKSLSGIYTLAGKKVRTPGMYMRRDPQTGLETKTKLRDTHEYVHPSVRARVVLEGPGVEDRGVYDPLALRGYKLRVTGAKPGGAEPMALWESRSKERKTRKPKRVLMESPLFETEQRLLSGSPWVQRYLMGEGKGAGRLPPPPPPLSAPLQAPQPPMGGDMGGGGGGGGGGRRRDRDKDRRRDRHRDREKDPRERRDRRDRSVMPDSEEESE